MDLLTALAALIIGDVPCNASVFGWQDDTLRGGEAVCLHRDLRPNDIGIAHRDLPCGTRVEVENPRTGKSVVARVVDHGPYGATFHGHWILKRRADERGTWRGCADLTVRTARLIGHNGFEPVVLKVQGNNTPVVQWEDAILTRWRRWIETIRGYHEEVSETLSRKDVR